MSYRIGAYLIDPGAYELRREGALVPVEPQVFDLLVFLIENRQRVLTKDEIIERVWKGRIVSDANLSSRIKAGRQALGDDGSAQRFIRTVHGRGFRFVGDVEVVESLSSVDPKQKRAGLVRRDEAYALSAAQSERAASPSLNTSPAAIPAGRRQWAATAAACVAVFGAAYLVNHLTRPAGSGASSALTRTVPSEPASAAQKVALTFKDCDLCPEMVELPFGEFMMGSPADEQGRQRVEGPQRPVIIARRLALGKFEITVDQFETFVTETGLTVANGCHTIDDKAAQGVPGEGSFRRPGFEVTRLHPVVCVSWHEAQAYATWLGRRTGKPYRLPSEAEWEYATRAGTTTSYSFGDDDSKLCQYARFADLDTHINWRGACRSGVSAHGPLEVGKLKPNPWGLFDMHGNAWEWVADCWTADGREPPTDGSAFTRPGGCEVGVARGGSWVGAYHRARSAVRMPMPAVKRFYHIGFRVALSIGSM